MPSNDFMNAKEFGELIFKAPIQLFRVDTVESSHLLISCESAKVLNIFIVGDVEIKESENYLEIYGAVKNV